MAPGREGSVAINLAKVLEPLAAREVVIRGVTLKMRAVSAREAMQLENQNPQPIADPEIPGESKYEGFLAKTARYQTCRRCMLIAIACNLSNAAGETWERSRDAAWIEAFTDELMDQLTEREIIGLWTNLLDIATVFAAPEKSIGTGTNPGN